MPNQSRAAIEEDRALAAQIAKAKEFSAHIRLGPHEKHTIRNLASYAEAKAAAADLEKLSKFGRRAIVYAINPLGSFPCDDRMAALAKIES